MKEKPWEFLILGCFLLFAAFAFLSVSLSQVGFLLTVVIYLIKVLVTRDFKLTRTPLDFYFLAFAGAVGLSVLNSVDRVFSFQQFLKFIPFLFVYFLFVTYLTKENLRLLLRVLIISACLGALYGVGEYSLKLSRINGPAQSAGTFANCLAIIISITLSLILFVRSETKKTWFLGLIALFALVLLLTFTRSAILGLAASVLTISFLKMGKSRKYVPGLAIIIILFVSVSFYLVGKARGEAMVHRSTMERVSIWRSGWQIIRDHPFTGVGLGCVREVYPRYKSPADSYPNRFELHNSFLQIWAECGPLALISFFSLILAFLFQAFRAFKEEEDDYLKAIIAGCLGGFLAMIVSGLFSNAFGDGGVSTLILFLMAATMSIRKWQIQARLPQRTGSESP